MSPKSAPSCRPSDPMSIIRLNISSAFSFHSSKPSSLSRSLVSVSKTPVLIQGCRLALSILGPNSSPWAMLMYDNFTSTRSWNDPLVVLE